MDDDMINFDCGNVSAMLRTALWVYIYLFESFEIHSEDPNKYFVIFLKDVDTSYKIVAKFQKLVTNACLHFMKPEYEPTNQMRMKLSVLQNIFTDDSIVRRFPLMDQHLSPVDRKESQKLVFLDIIFGDNRKDKDKNVWEDPTKIPFGLSSNIAIKNMSDFATNLDNVGIWPDGYRFCKYMFQYRLIKDKHKKDQPEQPWLAFVNYRFK